MAADDRCHLRKDPGRPARRSHWALGHLLPETWWKAAGLIKAGVIFSSTSFEPSSGRKQGELGKDRGTLELRSLGLFANIR
jgi:hypothetical protein